VLELREYETRRVELSPLQAGELAVLTRGSAAERTDLRIIQQILPTGREGWYDVQPGPFVGRFTTGSGLTVDVSSRFDFANLLEVLRMASRHPAVLTSAPIPARGGRGLLELIATAYVRELHRIAGFGLAKGYISRTFTRAPYPGVPDANAHLARHLGRPDRLVTRAQRLTVDIPVNQVLAAAHRVLRYQVYADPTLAVRLRSLTPVLAGVTNVPDAGRLARTGSRKVPSRYDKAHGLAVLVLAGLTTLPSGTGTTGPSVLFNMTKVWESYAQALIQAHLPTGHTLSAQHPVLLSHDPSRIQASADLVILGPSQQPLAIYDAKYKPFRSKPSPEEIYQLHTYAYRLGLKSGTLLYPGHGEHHEVVVGQYRIHTRGVDVLAPASEIAPLPPADRSESVGAAALTGQLPGAGA
jgi:5-methylcytosine-specific restriction endonuclease McrBC regulatory subunit McrC